MHRRGGMTTGDTTGRNVDADGIIGIGALYILPHHCRFISATIQATDIRVNTTSSAMRAIGITTMDLANPLDALAISNQIANDSRVRKISG